jgi:hypothetical protein
VGFCGHKSEFSGSIIFLKLNNYALGGACYTAYTSIQIIDFYFIAYYYYFFPSIFISQFNYFRIKLNLCVCSVFNLYVLRYKRVREPFANAVFPTADVKYPRISTCISSFANLDISVLSAPVHPHLLGALLQWYPRSVFYSLQITTASSYDTF